MPARRSKARPGKRANKLFYTIGEAAELTGAKAHSIRYWEKRIPQLSPGKSPGGKRVYREKDLRTISALRRMLEEEGRSLDDAKKGLAGREKGGTAEVAKLKQALRDVRAELEELKKTLE